MRGGSSRRQSPPARAGFDRVTTSLFAGACKYEHAPAHTAEVAYASAYVLTELWLALAPTICYIECQKLCDELRFQPTAQGFVYVVVNVALFVVQAFCGENRYVTFVVFQNGVDSLYVAA